MADEGQGKRRRRGRRKGRQEAHNRPEESAGQDDLSQGDVLSDDADIEVTSEADIPGVTGETPRIEGGRSARKERTTASRSGGPDVSPMDFWRSSRRRTARERRAGTGPQEPQGLWKRITSLYFPPWVPVVGVIVLVFGILGLLFITRSATGAPRIGEDHWHAQYTYYVCGEKQGPAPTWGGGVHTHGDGIVHIHPFSQSEEGAGSRLSKWFEYGGGKLDGDEVRLPGRSTTYKNGDECPDGTKGEVQVFVNNAKVEDYTRYIPKDGHRIRIVFGPPEEQVQLDDRIVLSEDAVTREIEVTVDQPEGEESTFFNPASISLDTGEVVKLIVHNVDEVSHGLRISGVDGNYGTNDDYVAVPEGSDPTEADLGDILQPGESGFVVVRFDNEGTIEFRDPTVTTATGNIIITETAAEETEAPEGEFDEELEVALLDSVFDPDGFTIQAGESVKINLPNEGEFAHNLRIAGPDGEYDTSDDIVSNDILPGEDGEMIFTIEEPGTYNFQCDFHVATMNGKLTVR